jgi:chromosome segregation ATPase
MNLRARRLRTHQQRVQQRIVSNTNAINKTLEEQSDEPPVVMNHTNTIPQLKRSIDVAENTLESLRDEVQNVKDGDKTYIVKELEEEVRLNYCEYQRMCKELQDARAAQSEIAGKLAEAEFRVSNQRITELRNEVRDLRQRNASLRDKAVAYYVKRGKLVAEKEIKDHAENKVPTQKTVQDINDKEAEVREQIKQAVQEIQQRKAEHADKIAQLRQIIEEQKQKIAAFLQETEVPEEIKPIPDDL